MPSPTGDVSADTSAPPSSTPALASAKIGMITKATQGSNACSIRANGVSTCSQAVSIACSAACVRSCPVGPARVALSNSASVALTLFVNSPFRRRTRAGIVAAASTPAIVACTPDSSTASQSISPNTP